MNKKSKYPWVEWVIVGLLCIAVGILTHRIIGESREMGIKEKMKNTKVVLYEGPVSLQDPGKEDRENRSEQSRNFALMHCIDTVVTVNGEECYVYDTNVNHTRTWVSNYFPPQSRTPITYFDFEGLVEIVVKVPDIDLDTVTLSPLAYGIEPILDKDTHTVTFTIDEPDTYTLQFNNSPERALHIFANPLETEVPDFTDPSVIYIGPGEWNIDSIMLEKGQTLYLAGGAVVHGIVNSNFNSNITVCGRGILDGSHLPGWQGTSAEIPLKFDHCSNVIIKDIIVLNANAWVCQAYDSKDGVIDGLKIISSRPNGDGITLQSCENYEVKNCFVRTWDDSLVIKNYDKNSQSISFKNMQLWTDFAQSMEIGYETNKGNKQDAYISDITFQNITVLHNFHKPVISVHNADDAMVEDVLFDQIVVEHEEVGSGDGDQMPYLIDIHIGQSSNWSTTRERGHIRNITISNVEFLGGNKTLSRIQGFDSEHMVEDIYIKNLTLFGKEIKTLSPEYFLIKEETVKNVTIQ